MAPVAPPVPTPMQISNDGPPRSNKQTTTSQNRGKQTTTSQNRGSRSCCWQWHIPEAASGSSRSVQRRPVRAPRRLTAAARALHLAASERARRAATVPPSRRHCPPSAATSRAATVPTTGARLSGPGLGRVWPVDRGTTPPVNV